MLNHQPAAIASELALPRPANSDARRAHDPDLTIGMIVSTWPRLSQTFVLREVLGLERLGLRVRIFSIKVPTGEPVHAEVAQVRAPVTYLAFRGSWRPILGANLRLVRDLGRLYFRTLFRGLGYIRYGNVLHILRQFLRGAYVADILRREPVDRIHAHFATAPASLAMFTSELTGIPYTFAVHANDIFVKARGRLLRAKIARAEMIVANNEHNRQYLLSRFGAELEGKVPRIYNGLDLSQIDFRWPRVSDPGPPLVLAVGRMVPKKGFGDLISATGILRDRGRAFRLEIIGEGPLKQRIQSQIEKLNLENVVDLRGAQAQDLVLSAYGRAAVFVLPCIITKNGDRDGIPNVLFEAMASGAPVISTTVSAIPELVQPDNNGLLIPPGNPSMLADAIDRLLLDPELRDRLARAARETIETRFTLDRTSRELFDLFQSLERDRH
jgi:glycosyltransferase involved in cell wall biosynthesis